MAAERKTAIRFETKLINLDDAAKALQWLRKIGCGDTPDAANARIIEGIIRGLQHVGEREQRLSEGPKHIK
jgi:hypothetical protein